MNVHDIAIDAVRAHRTLVGSSRHYGATALSEFLARSRLPRYLEPSAAVVSGRTMR